MRITVIFILACIGTLSNSAAQKFSGTLQMHLTEFNSRQLQALFPELSNQNTHRRHGLEILAIPQKNLEAQAQRIAVQPVKSAIKMQFAGDWFRADMPQLGSGISMIQNLQSRKLWNVDWKKQIYTEIDLQKIAEMQRGLREHYQKPADPFAYLKDLPPEKRAEILRKLPPETRQRMKENRGPFPLPRSPQEKTKMIVRRTGKKAKINGYQCEEYILENHGVLRSVWLTPAPAGLLQALKSLSRNYDRFGSGSTMRDIWQFAPAKMPVLIREFSFTPNGEVSLIITRMSRLTEKTLPAEIFKIPSSFKKASMMEILDMGQSRRF